MCGPLQVPASALALAVVMAWFADNIDIIGAWQASDDLKANVEEEQKATTDFAEECFNGPGVSLGLDLPRDCC